ncbi:MAG: hypothetical protein KF684_03710 [Phycisphaeraceae bacterium]|nr:hypothetical protein [Phycisphaeraceae bacterium]
MRSIRERLLSAAIVAACGLSVSTGASAQVVINEIFENPPGSGSIDNVWEFIELYGKPGMDLTGYAVAVLKGGYFVNGIQVEGQEIDEAFALDGIVLPENGVFAIVNANTAGFSSVGNTFLTPNPAWNPAMPDSLTNRRWLNGIAFAALHIPTTDTVGNLANDGSSTYVLVRKRPNHSINAMGRSVYAPGYAWRKDVNHDVNYDEVVDFGLPFEGGGARVMQPYQSVDEFAWSHTGGKEYTRSRQQVMSDTSGFNPDAVSRLNYFVTNPQRGHRSRPTDAGFEIVFSRIADESFVYGEVPVLSTLAYNTGVDTEGFVQTKAPTDPNGPRYDGSCDPEPEGVPPTGCGQNPAGEFLFDDLDVTGFRLTPGGFNDHPTNSEIRQFRFVRGDFNFDGVVDQADLDLIVSRLGATLDDTEFRTIDPGTPDNPNDDFQLLDWKWQVGEFQQILMMRDMDEADGPGGTNAEPVTMADVAALQALLPVVCPGDTNGDNVVNFADLNAVLSAFGQTGAGIVGDANNDGVVNFSDLNIVLSNFGVSCVR